MDPQWSALAEGEPATDGPTGSTGRTGSDTRMRGIRRRNHFRKVAEDVLHEGDSKLQNSYSIYLLCIIYIFRFNVFQCKSPVKMRLVDGPLSCTWRSNLAKASTWVDIESSTYLCWDDFTHTHTGTQVLYLPCNFLQATICHVGWRQCLECLTAKEHLRAGADFQRKKMRVNEVFFTHGDLVWVRKAHLRPRWDSHLKVTIFNGRLTIYFHRFTPIEGLEVLPCDMCFGSVRRGQCTIPQWWNLDTAPGRFATRSSVTYDGWSFALRCLQTQWQGSPLRWGVGWFCRHVL